MSKRCDKRMGSVYRRGNTLPLCGGGRSVLALSFALLVSICVLMLPVGGAMAQPAPAPPLEQPASASPMEQPAATPDAKGDTKSDAKSDETPGMSSADITAAREQQRTTAATRQQIQAIRAALRARLAALHR
jgi:hypothetical protein